MGRVEVTRDDPATTFTHITSEDDYPMLAAQMGDMGTRRRGHRPLPQ